MADSYGFKSRNHKTEIQIDDRFGNYAYVEGGDSQSGTNTHTFAKSTTLPPVVLVRPVNNNDITAVWSFGHSNGVFSSVKIHGSVGSYDYRVFFNKEAKEIQNAGEYYGIKIRNARGEVVFDSAYPPFTIVQVDTVTLPYSSYPVGGSDSGTITHSDYENPWYIYSPQHCGFFMIPTETPPISAIMWTKPSVKKLSSTTCCSSIHLTNMIIGAGGPAYSWQGTNVDVMTCTVNPAIQNKA